MTYTSINPEIELAQQIVDAFEEASENGAATDVLKWRLARALLDLDRDARRTLSAVVYAAGGEVVVTEYEQTVDLILTREDHAATKAVRWTVAE